MRYSSALVLSTLAIGQAAAVNVRHASFHSRRQAEAKRNAEGDGVNWEAIPYDLSKVDWKSVFNTQTPTPTPSAIQPKPTPKKTPRPEAQAEAKGGLIDDIINDISEGVADLIQKIGISAEGENSRTNNGKIWIGDDSQWKVNFVNAASDPVTVFCWADNGFTGMTLNVNQPLISLALKPGAKQVVSWAGDYPSACAPVYPDTKLAMFGGISNTWFEVTFPNGSPGSGAYDISRNVNMHGNAISAYTPGCTSDMDTCVFKCKGDVDSCETGYDLFNCNAGNGGGGGYDPIMDGTGGGCALPSDGETIEVTFS